ncbi:hypothetical protein [Mangrovicella endophytica]|uniref:hypothetical protein n=1 Tax=Mangrovicella endophytica TaxID=2066697 RepID=UPI0012FFF0E1|nr:hypothetical protein [Mangrovicella endophytica]
MTLARKSSVSRLLIGAAVIALATASGPALAAAEVDLAQATGAAPAAPTTPSTAAPSQTSPADVTAPAAPAAPAAEAPATVPPTAAETAAGAPSADGGEAMAQVQALPVAIQDVQVVGPWSEGERHGVWRGVMLHEPRDDARYRFFIQQIEEVGGAFQIKATTEVKEMASIDGAVVDYRADEPEEGDTTSLTLFFDIVPSDGEIAETYELHVFTGQPYTFGPASN